MIVICTAVRSPISSARRRPMSKKAAKLAITPMANANSRAVMPNWRPNACVFARRTNSPFYRCLTKIPNREEYTQGENQHEDAQKADQDRFDLRRQGFQFVFDISLIKLGDLAQHIVERTRLLAHSNHLQHHRGEDPARHRGVEHAAAALDAI